MAKLSQQFLEKLNQLEDKMDRIDDRLEQLLEQNKPPLSERKRWTKQDVLDGFKMSDSTYKRNKSSGLLVPITLSGFDEYFDEDLLQAMEESRRRGRI